MTTISAHSDSSIEEKYKRYMDNIKKANKRYIETHKDQINEKARNYYHTTLVNNEEYKLKKREYNKQLYIKKKEAKTLGKIE
jgi:hypothetical protein